MEDEKLKLQLDMLKRERLVATVESSLQEVDALFQIRNTQ
jgi:hypothetical protein